jgi:DNA-binding transcriptional regulator YiaG
MKQPITCPHCQELIYPDLLPKDPSSFASRIKAARVHLSQTQAAEIIGKKVQSLRNWEQGRNEPDAETQAICLSLLHAELNPEY